MKKIIIIISALFAINIFSSDFKNDINIFFSDLFKEFDLKGIVRLEPIIEKPEFNQARSQKLDDVKDKVRDKKNAKKIEELFSEMQDNGDYESFDWSETIKKYVTQSSEAHGGHITILSSNAFWEYLFFRIMSFITSDNKENYKNEDINYERIYLSFNIFNNIFKDSLQERILVFDIASEQITTHLNNEDWREHIKNIFNEGKRQRKFYNVKNDTNLKDICRDYFDFIINVNDDVFNYRRLYDSSINDCQIKFSDDGQQLKVALLYNKFLIVIVDSWLKKNYKTEKDFIENLLGNNLYNSLGKTIKSKPKKIQQKSNDFSSSTLLNDISVNKEVVKEIIEHMKSHEQDFPSFGLTNIQYIAGTETEKVDIARKFGERLKETGFDKSKLKIIKDTVKNNSIKITKVKKKQRKQKNPALKKVQPNIEEKKDEKVPGFHTKKEIKDIKKQPQNKKGFSKPKIKQRIEKRKYTLIYPNISKEEPQKELNKDKKDPFNYLSVKFFNELDEINYAIFNGMMSSLAELRNVVLLILDEQVITNQYVLELINKYKVALNYHLESGGDKLNIQNIEIIKNPQIEQVKKLKFSKYETKKVYKFEALPDSVAFTVEPFKPVMKKYNKYSDQGYYFYLERIRENRDFILSDNYINFDYNDNLNQIEAILDTATIDNKQGIEQLIDFHHEIVGKYWELQKVVAECLLVVLGFIDPSLVINEKVLENWQDLFQNVKNDSIRWNAFWKKLFIGE